MDVGQEVGKVYWSVGCGIVGALSDKNHDARDSTGGGREARLGCTVDKRGQDKNKKRAKIRCRVVRVG